jgi:hypothetical protein
MVAIIALFAMLQSAPVLGWFPYGKPFPALNSPAPRLPNGKPSMAGMWGQFRRADVTAPGISSLGIASENPNAAGYVRELPYTEWGKKQWEGYDPVKNGDYAGSCLPFGFPRTVFGPHPIHIMHDNDNIVFLAEQNSWFHLVPTDGRPFNEELPPTWWGESVGRWDVDTLIIETTNINGYTKVDTIGHPLSNQAKITQTFKRIDFGRMEHTFTVNDPKTYTKPWTVNNLWTVKPADDRILEYSCEENNEGLYDGTIVRWRIPEDVD